MTKALHNDVSPTSEDIHLKVLIELTEQLKIPDGKYKSAVEKYENVGKYLNESTDPVLKDAEIYIQGSVKLGTTVKPYKYDEHDIDLVIHLPHIDETFSSQSIKNAVGDRLRQRYASKLTELNRGWRIEYEGDFHLDITPAIPDDKCNNACPINKHYAEFVPDSKLIHWKASNPRGYYKWFHKIDGITPVFAIDKRSILAFESKNVETAPTQHEFKGILRRTIQLLKRHRDMYIFEKHEHFKNYAPISILITTLAAQAYEDLVANDVVYTPIELIKQIINNMGLYIQKSNDQYIVANPTNHNENFAEKWNTSHGLHEKIFNLWIKAAYNDLENILTSTGIDNVAKAINSSFGGNYGNKVIESINKEVAADRGLGLLSGVLLTKGASEASVAKNTFYGK